MAMYYYASKLSAIACGTRCKQAVLQKNRGQRDRDKDRRRMHARHHADENNIGDIGNDTDDFDCDLQVSDSLKFINKYIYGFVLVNNCFTSNGHVILLHTFHTRICLFVFI